MNFFDIFEEPDKVNSEKRTLSLRGTDRRNSLRLTSGRSTEGIDHFRRVQRLTILPSSVPAPWLKSSSSTSRPENRENLSPTEGGESSHFTQERQQLPIPSLDLCVSTSFLPTSNGNFSASAFRSDRLLLQTTSNISQPNISLFLAL